MKPRLRAVRLKLSSMDKIGETRLHSILVWVFQTGKGASFLRSVSYKRTPGKHVSFVER